MRVLHVFKDAFPPTFGGVEQHIWEVSRSLRPAFESEVLTSSRSRFRVEQDVEGVKIVRTPELGRLVSTPLTPSWWPEVRRAGAAGGALLHLHLPNPMAELAALTSGVRSPVVASFHADVTRNPSLARWYSGLQQRFLSRADRIVVGSAALVDTSPALVHHRERTVVIPYGVDPDDWPADPVRAEEIRRSACGPIVLFLGRLVHYKGVDVLIDAMRSVRATLFVVGDGPGRGALEGAARRAALAERVRFVGNVTNRERSAYYRAASVFVLPAVSRAETFGIAMLEAMSYGTPAICTEVGTGTSWVNLAGETGLVVPPRHPAALAEAITTLLEDDRLRMQFGDAAARRAHQHFSKGSMLDQLATVYRSLGSDLPAGTTSDSTGR